MFGLSTELITKGKLATVKRFECDVSSVSPSSERIEFAQTSGGLTLEMSALESLYGDKLSCQFC